MSFSKIPAFAVLVLMVPIASAAPILTGAVLFNSTATGAYDASGVAWNTVGGDIPFNLYFQDSAVFVNSGNGASTALSIDLLPGSYTFDIFGQPGSDPPEGFAGLNLFFDGATTVPDISAFNVLDGAGSPTATAASTLGLNAITVVPGSGTLTFFRAGNTVSLSTFTWNRPSSAVGDVVSPYNNIPDGTDDYWGSIQLTVAEGVPEPGTLLLVGAALLVFGLRRSESSAARKS